MCTIKQTQNFNRAAEGCNPYDRKYDSYGFMSKIIFSTFTVIKLEKLIKDWLD